MRAVQVAAGLICQDGRYLIARRKANVHLGGLWEFPGGRCESGESLEECLRRELREELAIVISRPVPFQTIRYEYPEKTVELHFFRCAIVEGQASAVDCAEIRWVEPHEFASFEFPPADQPVVDALLHEAAGLSR